MDIAYSERLKIGFNDLATRWPDAEAIFTSNSLKICGHPVMERWETSYMKKLAAIAASNGGIILEVGFGLGISAAFIQQQPVRLHMIIEANHQVFWRVKKFASKSKVEVRPILGLWQDKIADIAGNSIDGILFDTYPLMTLEIHRNHFSFFKHAYRILKIGGVFTYYSDEQTWFSEEHLFCLRQAGFSKIYGQICQVSPPVGCQYWRSDTILAPIIIK